MSEEEKELLTKYGCTTLYEFVDVVMDFDMCLKILKDYFKLQQENKQLKEQLEYLRSGEYLIQLKFERDMLQDLVDDKKISNKEYTIKKLMSGNTMLAEQLKQRDEVIDEATKKVIKWDSSSTCAIDDYYFKEEILEILQKYKGDNK